MLLSIKASLHAALVYIEALAPERFAFERFVACVIGGVGESLAAFGARQDILGHIRYTKVYKGIQEYVYIYIYVHTCFHICIYTYISIYMGVCIV